MLGFWAIALPIAALITVPWALITGNVRPLYRIGMWGAFTGVRLAGVRVKTIGRENLDPRATYIFMANHASNIDPPLLLPIIPGRSSVMARHELFNYPILGRAMRIASLVPVNRGNREAGIAAVRAAEQVVHQGIHMTIFVEGGRSFDGKLLPFKKGPFHLAIESGVDIIPVTIHGTEQMMPKGTNAIRPGVAHVIFHAPVSPKDYGSREELTEAVRKAIESSLPAEMRST